MVWKAISSIVFTILWVLSLAEAISSIAPIRRSKEALVLALTALFSSIRPLASWTPWALLLAMEATSSMELEVSSREEACSEAPSASC